MDLDSSSRAVAAAAAEWRRRRRSAAAAAVAGCPTPQRQRRTVPVGQPVGQPDNWISGVGTKRHQVHRRSLLTRLTDDDDDDEDNDDDYDVRCTWLSLVQLSF